MKGHQEIVYSNTFAPNTSTSTWIVPFTWHCILPIDLKGVLDIFLFFFLFFFIFLERHIHPLIPPNLRFTNSNFKKGILQTLRSTQRKDSRNKLV